ncbi:unnamed protein product, partial [Symbiodinium necroappetens]
VRDQSPASASMPLPVPLATAEPEGFAQPWDEGVFGVIFGDKDFLDFPVAKLGPTFLPGEGSQSSEVVEMPSKRLKVVHKDVSYSRVVKSRAAVDWKQQRSAQLEIGLQTWLELVLKWGPCVLTSHVEACTSRCDQLEVIGDILKGKAPSTILKRARALILLQDFLKERDSFFPCAEEEVYQFLKVLERDKAPKSRIASVMEALNFTLHVGHADPWTRLFAGAALVCAYARRHRFLHAVAPALGIRPYGHLWKQCREQLGVEVSGSCPFMPAPDAQGQPTIRALDSDEATAWLRMLFGQTKVCGDTSSKSLKATVISWAAKRGVEPLSLQRLGYHASGGMDIVYSRDAQAPLVMLVERLLREVAEGSFKPDDTRSGRIVTSGAVPLVQPVQPVGSELVESLATSSGVASQARLQCKEEQLPGSKSDAAVLQVDSDSEGFASEGESMESSDEDEGQPIALVAQGHLVPPGFDIWRTGGCTMALIASEAAFLQRCTEVSPDGSLHTALLGQGIKNFRQLAFSIGTPRVEPSAAQYLELATQIFGASPSLGNVAMLRDLHFESTTYVIQVFKEQATSDGTDTQVKRLPMPERAARAAEQQRRLCGVSISGELQPSYSLIDKCNTMYESGALVWLAPSVCSKRDAEVSLGVNEKSPVVHLEKDSLKLAAPAQKIPVDLSSPLCLQWAWQRRGIALDQCSLLTWKVHEEYVHRLLNFLTEVWTLLAREVPPPYKTLADGTKPLDQPFKAMAFDQRSSTDAAMPYMPEIPPHVVDGLPRCAKGRSPSRDYQKVLGQWIRAPSLCDILELFDALPKSPSPRQSEGCPAKRAPFISAFLYVGGSAGLQIWDTTASRKVVDENISGDEVVLSKRRLKFVAKWTARAKELEVRRPEFSVDTLKHLADGLNKATREKMAQRQSPELEQATWNETLAELQSEWIWQAPDSEEDVKVYARRFGLDQHGKIRVIDDCSCCGLNATVGVVERFVVHAIDRMASMLAYALEVSKDASTSLCGRTYDLKSAYKQFPVSCKDRDLLRMWVNCPHRSVAAFLRISNSIWMIGTIALRVLWLLGLTYAREGKKAPEFAPVFNMLGVDRSLPECQTFRTAKRSGSLRHSLSASAVKAIGGVGAILYNNVGCAVGAFGSTVPQTFLN